MKTKTKTNTVHELRRFFLNAFINAEVSQTEVVNFLQNYLEYIFKLNHLDIKKYDISISTTQVDEYHPKREKKYKQESNQESRRLIKQRVLTKPSHKSNCGNHYFDAVMQPHPTIENKYTILLNKNSCQAKNDFEITNLVNLFSIFGHEVHHIVQYIKRPKEMERYDYLLELHNLYLKNADKILTSRKDAKKLKNAINRHLSLMFSNCKSEMFADKKGYDYLDILFNEILSTLPNPSSMEEDMFITFIRSLKETNFESFLDRCYGYYIEDLKNADSTNLLTNFNVEEDVLEID